MMMVSEQMPTTSDYVPLFGMWSMKSGMREEGGGLQGSRRHFPHSSGLSPLGHSIGFED